MTNKPNLWFRRRVPSKSVPGKMYVVDVYDSGEMHCTGWDNQKQEQIPQGCMASETGKICRHQKIVYQWMSALLKVMSETYGEKTTSKMKLP